MGNLVFMGLLKKERKTLCGQGACNYVSIPIYCCVCRHIVMGPIFSSVWHFGKGSLVQFRINGEKKENVYK